MSSIPPINSSNWKSQVNPTTSVENQGGGAGSAGGYIMKEEKTDEATFHNAENEQDELNLLENKSLLTIIKELFTSLWTFILKLLGIKTRTQS